MSRQSQVHSDLAAEVWPLGAYPTSPSKHSTHTQVVVRVGRRQKAASDVQLPPDLLESEMGRVGDFALLIEIIDNSTGVLFDPHRPYQPSHLLRMT
jgi:hypothetical protein